MNVNDIWLYLILENRILLIWQGFFYFHLFCRVKSGKYVIIVYETVFLVTDRRSTMQQQLPLQKGKI